MNQIEQTLTSLEVAEMVEKTHANLLKDIRRYCKQLGEVKINFTDFFTESSYKTEQGKELPCYKITKKGCEFIAHKMTGVKGTAFTARYINRFHDMEEAIIQQTAQPKIEQRPNTSTASIPLVTDWFKRVDPHFRTLMKKMELSRKGVYHEILLRLGEVYNLDVAKRIYRKENGFAPPYAMTLVEYFPQLQEEADKIINELLKEYE